LKHFSKFAILCSTRQSSIHKYPLREFIIILNKETIYKVAGRTSLCVDWPRRLLGRKEIRHEGTDLSRSLDKTGVVVSQAKPLEVWWEDPEILYVNYGSFGHSFWRAQELSLFRSHRSQLEKPLLDFGCGDGSFASALFDGVDVGVDIDQEALAMARQFHVHKRLIQSTNSAIPLDDGCMKSAVSNSVLEHVVDLERMLQELYRVLAGNGVFMFTVPVKQYERDLAKYFGRTASLRVNQETYHRNLFEAEEWRCMLERHGFTIFRLMQFQPDWFTFWFRMFRLLGDKGLNMFIPGIREIAWRRYKLQLVNMVRDSIKETTVGNNIFVVARKQ
jgi:ubiquinone/menaquinone biosynthesis C-methylase UbiE